MEVNDRLIEKLATLSRLEFDGEAKLAIKEDLQNMIAFVEKLNEIDTTGVAPLLHMSKNVNVLRADETKGSVDRDIALKNASNSDGVYFKVPKVINKIPSLKK
ncbi:MAG: Asp-tRNA(Asn)/Glu-tRNA(Gln) amidotransferase subunit GatC [Chitinophagaceae bacterium]